MKWHKKLKVNQHEAIARFVCGMKKNFLLFVKKLNENIEECDKITLVLTRGDRGNNTDITEGNIRHW